MSEYKDLGAGTTTMALCVNCGFAGATQYINGNGPYCGRCAEQASPTRHFDSPSPSAWTAGYTAWPGMSITVGPEILSDGDTISIPVPLAGRLTIRLKNEMGRVKVDRVNISLDGMEGEK